MGGRPGAQGIYARGPAYAKAGKPPRVGIAPARPRRQSSTILPGRGGAARGRLIERRRSMKGRSMRKASLRRTTKETDVEVAVDLDGTGNAAIATGIGFLDHMLDLLARHSRVDLSVTARGDLHIDHHHTTEDVGIALGQALKQALGDMTRITRYADVHVPMDEALPRAAIDISGRPFLVF